MITNIHLINFKCFDDLDIDLSNLTLFMGINGVGKSSVIQSLLLQRQSLNDPKVDFKNEVLFDGDLVNLKGAYQMRYISAKDSSISISYIEDDNEYGTTIPNATKEETISQCEHNGNYDQMISQSALFKDSFVYLYADRTIPQDVYSRIATSKTNSRLGDRSGHLTASYLLNTLNDPSIRDVAVEGLVTSKKGNSVLVNTSAWLSQIMSTNTDISVSEKSSQEVSLTYGMTTKDIGGFSVSPLNMPFGNSYLLPIIVAILSAPKGSLVIVENPEAHLHPSAQTKLGQFFSLAAHLGIQIFVETHSDHIVNGIRLSVKNKEISTDEVALHFIYEDKDDPMDHLDERIFIGDDGELNQWPPLFLDEWERSLYNLSKKN